MEIVDRRVPLSEIGKTVGPAPVARFVANVRRNGVIIPILLREVVTDGGAMEYRIVDGNRRVAAAREVGHHDIPARVLSGVSSEEAARLVLMANNFRSDNDITEFWAIKHLERSGARREEVAEDAGIDPRYLRVRDRWSTFDRRLFTAYAAGKLPATVANKIVKMKAADQRYFGDLFERKGRVLTDDLRDRPQQKKPLRPAPVQPPNADAHEVAHDREAGPAALRPASTRHVTDDDGQPVTIVTTGPIAGSLPAELRQAVETVAHDGVRGGIPLPDLTSALTFAYQQAASGLDLSKERTRG